MKDLDRCFAVGSGLSLMQEFMTRVYCTGTI